jgi:hypothetical protein
MTDDGYLFNSMAEYVLPKIELMFFYTEQCHQCKKALTVLKNKYESEIYTINNKKGIIQITEMDCNETPDACFQRVLDSYDIDSYPSVVGISYSIAIKFKGEMKASSLEEFIQTLPDSCYSGFLSHE